MLHLQLGPSPLALGLLIPTTLEAGFDVCVVGRPGPEQPRRYALNVAGNRQVFKRVRWFIGPRDVDDVPDEVKDRLRRHDEPVLVTATLRSAILERRSFLEGLLELRPVGSETVVIACENDPHPVYAELAAAYASRGIAFCDTVVNRICRMHRRGEGQRAVDTHRLGEWIVRRDPSGAGATVLVALDSASDVTLVEQDLLGLATRKRWLVNGGHLALGILARERGLTNLRVAAADDHVQAYLNSLHAEMRFALSDVAPDLVGEDALHYGIEHVIAYAEVDFDTEGVMKGFQRADLTGFMRGVEQRLAQSAQCASARGMDVAAHALVFARLHELMRNPTRYGDAHALLSGELELSEELDEEAIASYGRALAGWKDPADVEDRVVSLRNALIAQRDRFDAGWRGRAGAG